MSKAEEAAMKVYPPKFTSGKRYAKRVQSEKVDTHAPIRKIYLKGYEQAEKDLALTWEDIKTIVQILAESDWYDFEISNKLWSQEFYEEVLTRFKQLKED